MVIIGFNDTSIRVLNRRYGRDVAARTFLPAGIVKNGQVENVVTFKDILRQTLQEIGWTLNPNQSKPCTLALADTQAFIKTVSLPTGLSLGEARSTITLQWEHFFPINPEDVYFRLDALPMPQAGSSERSYLFTAYPKKNLDTAVAILAEAGLSVEICVPTCLGLAQSINHALKLDPALVLDSPNGDVIEASVVKNGTCTFSITVHCAVQDTDAPNQIKKLLDYLEQNDPEYTKITQVAILDGQYQAQLTGIAQALTLAGTLLEPQLFTNAKTKMSPDSAYIIPLVGLRAIKSDQTLLPEAKIESIRRQHATSLFRGSTLIYIVSIAIALTWLGIRHTLIRQITPSGATDDAIPTLQATVENRLKALNVTTISSVYVSKPKPRIIQVVTGTTDTIAQASDQLLAEGINRHPVIVTTTPLDSASSQLTIELGDVQ